MYNYHYAKVLYQALDLHDSNEAVKEYLFVSKYFIFNHATSKERHQYCCHKLQSWFEVLLFIEWSTILFVRLEWIVKNLFIYTMYKPCLERQVLTQNPTVTLQCLYVLSLMHGVEGDSHTWKSRTHNKQMTCFN